jgi:hypothetical protein
VPRTESSLQQSRGRQVLGRHGPCRRGRSGVLDERRLVRLRPGRAPRPLRRQLRAVDDRDRPDLHARRPQQVILHP